MYEYIGNIVDILNVRNKTNNVVGDEECCHESELEDNKFFVVILLVEQLLTT